MSDEVTTTEEKKPTPRTDDELRQVFEKLQAKFGDSETIATKLIKQNIDLGTKLAAVEAKLAAAEEKATKAALPVDHVAISKADADALAAYRALGDPAKVKEALDRLPTIEADLKRRDRDAELDAVAKSAGYAPAVFRRVVPDAMHFAPKTVRLRGEDVEVFEAVDTDEAGKERRRPLSDVEESEWKDMLPALKPDGAATSNRTLPRGGSPYRAEARIYRPAEEPGERKPTAQELNRRAVLGAGIGI